MTAAAPSATTPSTRRRRTRSARYLSDNLQTDIILLDLNLPDCHGIQTFEKMHSGSLNLPIIVLTGNEDDELALEAVGLGAQDYLVKGRLEKYGLIRAIRYAIERNQILQELAAAREVEKFLAYHDFLTELPNRHLFYDHLGQAIVHAERYDDLLALLFVDLDDFKELTDKFGHTAGDLILQDAAERLKGCVRKSDTIARWGWDEFAIILRPICQALDASKVAEKILDALSQPFHLGGQELSITASLGISLCPSDSKDRVDSVRMAETAMRRAKRKGKNNWQYYDSSVNQSYVELQTRVRSLQRAVERDELTAYFQPQIDVTTGEVTGVEAFVRWRHPEQGLIEPADFIGLAEETGIILQIDEWMVRTACQHAQAWLETGLPSMRISVNLSARFFLEKTSPGVIAGILYETSMNPNLLVLEITEDDSMKDSALTSKIMREFKALGVQIALHQFGTGHSSLDHLRHLPRDILKIDRSLIQGLPTDPGDLTLTTAIMSMAQSLDLKVIAEGVETEEQLSFLSHTGCHEIQGYYVSEPVPADSLATVLLSRMCMTGQVAEA